MSLLKIVLCRSPLCNLNYHKSYVQKYKDVYMIVYISANMIKGSTVRLLNFFCNVGLFGWSRDFKLFGGWYETPPPLEKYYTFPYFRSFTLYNHICVKDSLPHSLTGRLAISSISLLFVVRFGLYLRFWYLEFDNGDISDGCRS